MTTVANRPLSGVRADFPILEREVNGYPLAYLDSAATSQKPRPVLDAMDAYYRASNANVHRGVYELGREATELFEGARDRVAEFAGWGARTTIFTANATAAINLVAYSWGEAYLSEGDEVVVTEMEHHSNLVPWQEACRRAGAKLRYLRVSDEGLLSLDQLDELLAGGRVKMVAVAHISNVIGTINPVAEIAARAKAAGATSLVDGSQAVPQLPFRVSDVDADFYVWTGHKALGPTGIGVLHGRRALLESMPPFLSGGHMISSVSAESSTWDELPAKFEAGTSPIAEAVGLGAAVDYLSSVGMENVRAHEAELTAYALERLPEIPGIHIPGPPADQRGGVVSFGIDGIHPHDIAEICDRFGVCVRAGHHCAQPLMRCIGMPATARASFQVYNTREEVDRLVEALHEARRVFGLTE
ncbi:MAG: cysteine desulfurase [Thermoleophilaceae bacterium]